MTIIAEKIISGGDSLAKINGKAVFIPQLLPGEKADIEITESKKDYDRGRVVKILEASPFRREPPCPYYGTCGGCNLQIAQDEYQKEIRKGILKDSFIRAIRPAAGSDTLNAIENLQIICGKDWEYRNRFQFHSGGLMKKAQDSIIAVKDCPVAVPEIRTLLKEGRLPIKNGRLHVFNGHIAHEPAGNEGFSRSRDNDVQEISATICGKEIFFDIRGFFQSNTDALEKAALEIRPLISRYKGRELLDMYSGVGTFSTLFGEYFSRCTLVEHNRKALRTADRNLSGKAHDTFAMSGENWIKTKAAKKDYGVVLIDPPRSGIEKPVMKWLCDKKPEAIFSISCDPVTHARDAALLLSAGYRLETLKLLDFYPQTSHIESFALFVPCER